LAHPFKKKKKKKKNWLETMTKRYFTSLIRKRSILQSSFSEENTSSSLPTKNDKKAKVEKA
jgi:hypothetical protein